MHESALSLSPGEEVVTRESFISIAWRLIPYYLNQARGGQEQQEATQSQSLSLSWRHCQQQQSRYLHGLNL